MKQRFALVLSLAGLVLALDQFTKYLVAQALPLGSSREVIPGYFNLVHTLNRGAAFSFLHSPDGQWQRWFFVAMTCAAVILLLYLVRRFERGGPLTLLGFGLVLGGALGNLVDRLIRGEVVDFLDVHVGTAHWPAFNVADSALSLGAVALILGYLRMPKESK